MTNFGHYAENKSLPSWLLGMHPEKRKAFFNGYILADGHTITNSQGNASIAASTVSHKLAVSLRLLGLSLGFSVTIFKHTPSRKCTIEGRVVNEKPSFKIVFSDTDRSSCHSNIVDGDVKYRSGLVKQIKQSETVAVYDITVADDESFVADGIVVHNCQEWSQANCHADPTSSRALALDNCYPIIKHYQPEQIVIENVRAFQNSPPMDRFRSWLTDNGYHYIEQIINCADLGVPQTRIRYFLIATKIGRSLRYCPLTHSNKQPGQTDLFSPQLQPWIGWYNAIADLIPSMTLTELSANQQKAVNNLGGGLIESRTRSRGASKLLIPTIGYHGDAPPIYSESQPSPTVKAMMMSDGGRSERKGCWRLFDGYEVRECSIRALARFQSFPDDLVLSGRNSLDCKGIGNAVPPLALNQILSHCF
jgi:site-specific DNA-cytosine methylase